MRVLFDTNVLLDVLNERQPWYADSDAVWNANDQGNIEGYITATTLTDVFYVARRARDIPAAFDAIRACPDSFEIISVDRLILTQALALPGSDFEDNLQIACAQAAQLDAIVSRDVDGFRQSSVIALTPTELLARLSPPLTDDQPPAP